MTSNMLNLIQTLK